MKALVTIIIPLYNCEVYIEKCIQSLLSQSYDNIEIIIVDDGSTDSSAKIVKQMAQTKPCIKYYYQTNSGPGKARNIAIQNATGKYLLFVDADDYLNDDYVKALVEEAEKNDSDLTFGGYTLVYSNGKKNKEVIPQFYEKNVAEEWAYRISSSCSHLYRKDFWLKHELKFSQDREARAEDVPIVLYANVMAKNISIVKNSGYCYYQHPKSAMNDRTKKVLFDFPYQAFEDMYKKVRAAKTENSVAFFDFGVLKFLAHFDLVIYRRADKTKKEKFKEYLCQLIRKNYVDMSFNWKKMRAGIALPITHKAAIDLFIFKYRGMMRK